MFILELFGSDSIHVPPSLLLLSVSELVVEVFINSGAKLMKNCVLYSDF